jgi:hypothetical protein
MTYEKRMERLLGFYHKKLGKSDTFFKEETERTV